MMVNYIVVNNMNKIPIIFDMETGDPDDFLTLVFLCGHPRVDFKAVTITPGTPAQVGLVQYALKLFNLNIPVGAYNMDHDKNCVSNWHYNVFGKIPESKNANYGWLVLKDYLGPSVTLLTGAPLKNLGKLIFQGEVPITKRWVAQGGFAGDGVVPVDWQLEKFKGMAICPTYNFNGDPKSAMSAITCSRILEKYFVSKNVCHGVYYDSEIHNEIAKIKDDSLSLSIIWKGMDYYLKKHPEGKKFHDPLAACCALDLDVGYWSEPIALYREKGKWGAKLVSPEYPDQKSRIILKYNRERFLKVLMEK